MTTDQLSPLTLDDRGFLYGDGLFTTMAVIQGRALNPALHWQRLQSGCVRLGISVPDQAVWEKQLRQAASGMERGVLKCIVTRGRGGRGYYPPSNAQPGVFWLPAPWPAYPPAWWTDGVAIRLCRLRLGWQPALAGIKHLNRLEQVLARAEWDDPEIAEGLVRDQAGNLIEGCMSNLFFVDQDGLHTPALHHCGVAGIIRGIILALARSWDIPAQEGDYPLAALERASEIFLSNSLIGVWPVRRLEQRDYPVGALTRRLQASLSEHAYATFSA